MKNTGCVSIRFLLFHFFLPTRWSPTTPVFCPIVKLAFKASVSKKVIVLDPFRRICQYPLIPTFEAYFSILCVGLYFTSSQSCPLTMRNACITSRMMSANGSTNWLFSAFTDFAKDGTFLNFFSCSYDWNPPSEMGWGKLNNGNLKFKKNLTPGTSAIS